MRIVLASASSPSAARTIKVLQVRHDVALARNPAELQSRLGERVTDVLLMDQTFGGHAAESLGAFRAMCTKKRVYVVALLEPQPTSEVHRALQAGADDFIRKPFCDEDLLARVEAPCRIATWTSVARNVHDWSTLVELTETSLWRLPGQVVIAALSELVRTEIEESSSRPQPPGYAASIPLTASNAEVRLGLVLEGDAARAIALKLLGDSAPSNETLDDLTREAANTIAGAVKRAAHDEGIALTLGLPSSVHFGAVLSNEPSSKRRDVFCRMGCAGLSVTLALVDAAPKWVAASSLSEGMVLAHDLHTSNGLLLASAGTRLTRTTADRLARLLGATRLEVASASAAARV